jgi:hypothetical protein
MDKKLAYPIDATREDREMVDKINDSVSNIIYCDLCGTPCTVEGEVTHYYKPIADITALQAEIAELRQKLAVKEKLIKLMSMYVPEWEFIKLKAKAEQEV